MPCVTDDYKAEFEFAGYNVGDIVKRSEFKGMPTAYVMILSKREVMPFFWGYEVLEPDGSILDYTDAMLRPLHTEDKHDIERRKENAKI